MNRSPPPTLCRRIGGRFRKPNAARSDESGAAAAVSRARRRAAAARRVAVGTDSLSVCAPHHQVPPHIRAIPPGAALVRRRLRAWAAPLVYAQDSMRRMPPAGRGGNIGFHDICPPLIHARPPRSLIPSGVVGPRDGAPSVTRPQSRKRRRPIHLTSLPLLGRCERRGDGPHILRSLQF